MDIPSATNTDQHPNGMEMSEVGGGAWPTGAGPHQHRSLNIDLVPPPYSVSGGRVGQMPTVP